MQNRMKKIILFIFILLLNFAPAKAQYVTIPDAEFVTWLTQNYPACMNGNQLDTTCAQIVLEDSVTINPFPMPPGSGGIIDISGIEYFVNLTYLDCQGENIASLPTLPDSLKVLNCSENQITNLPSLPVGLKELFCGENLLTTIPPLPNSLQMLDCTYNPDFNSLPPLPNSMIKLSIGGILLTSIPTLPDSLKELSMYYCGITSPPILPNSLNLLSINYDQFTSLPVLPNTLKEFYLGNSSLLNLPSLILPDSLTYFTIHSNPQLTSLPPLPNSLVQLSCNYNHLTTLPPLPNTLLTLICNDNYLTSLPALPFSLEHLYCQTNNLTSLPAIPSSMEDLVAYSNQITSLPQLPDTMWTLMVYANNISCVYNLPQNPGILGQIQANPITCVPNQTDYSLGLPLCIDNDPVNNPNNCNSIVNISGHVFSDENGNCIFDSLDVVTENIPVQLFDSLNTLVAQNYVVAGTYGFSVAQPGAYKLKIQNTNLPFAIACAQADSLIVNLDSLNTGITHNNFPVICNQPYDLFVQSINRQGWVFPGQVHTVNTNVVNNGTWYNLDCDSVNYSGTIIIEIGGPVLYNSPAPNALTPQVNGNIFTYAISDFNNLTTQSFGLKLLTDTSATANDSICVHVEIHPSPLDNDTINNIYDFCYNVMNSYDPNMKEVFPANIDYGFEDWLTYTIHFQNTGNAPAFNIRLKDTIDTNLDMATFEIRGYSHPATATLFGNILSVKFANIMLPDSTTDFDGSMGYFQYRIKPYPNLPLGAQIENTAYIYFDYNSPIVTNTTQSNFGVDGIAEGQNLFQHEFEIYPNPSSGIFYFKDSRNIQSVEGYNLLGEKVFIQGAINHINLQNQPKGIYLVRVNSSQTLRVVKE
jgi:uncharacterized repeat protein (TIGR01451 family)